MFSTLLLKNVIYTPFTEFIQIF